MIQDIGFKSDKGIRRYNNEDAFFVMPEESIFIVADGVGGNNAGEIASRTTISTIVEYVRNNPLPHRFDDVELRAYFSDCVNKVNKKIYDMANNHIENAGMATTLVMAYAGENSIYVVNVGDSRAYLLRGGELTQITDDHTYVNSLVKCGSITEEQARTHKDRHAITRAIGGEELVFPDFFKVSAKKNDILLLCTDGLHGEVSADVISSILSSDKSMAQLADELVRKANQNGGNDNITVVCFRI